MFNGCEDSSLFTIFGMCRHSHVEVCSYHIQCYHILLLPAHGFINNQKYSNMYHSIQQHVKNHDKCWFIGYSLQHFQSNVVYIVLLGLKRNLKNFNF